MIVVNTNAFFGENIPHFAIDAGIGDTVISVPNRFGRAFASPSVLVPDHSSSAVLDNGTELIVPLGSRRTDARFRVLIEGLSGSTEHTGSSIVVEVLRAFANHSLLIPTLATTAVRLRHTGGSIPEVLVRAETLFVFFVVDSSSGTSHCFFTEVAIPKKACLASARF